MKRSDAEAGVKSPLPDKKTLVGVDLQLAGAMSGRSM